MKSVVVAIAVTFYKKMAIIVVAVEYCTIKDSRKSESIDVKIADVSLIVELSGRPDDEVAELALADVQLALHLVVEVVLLCNQAVTWLPS